MRGLKSLCVVLCLQLAAAYPALSKELDARLDFRDSHTPVPLVSQSDVPKIKPWTAKEKALVRGYFGVVQIRVPGLVDRITAYRPLRLYRSAAISDASAAAQSFSPDNSVTFFDLGMQAIRGGGKKGEEAGGLFNTALASIIHELTHLVDAAGILSETTEWRGLVGARIRRVRDAVKRLTGQTIDERYATLSHQVQKDALDQVVMAEMVPSLYAATKPVEALAEYAAYMKILKDPPFPQDVMRFVQKHVLSPPTGKVPAQMHYAEAMSRLEEENWTKAIVAFDKALDSAPEFLSARKTRVTLLIIEKRDDEAILEIGKVIDLARKLGNPRKVISGYYVQRGAAQRRLGRDNAAIADFTAAIEVFDRDPDAFEKRGDLWLKIFQLDKAIADLNASIALRPNSYVARLRRGYAYYYKRQAAKALPDFEAAMQLAQKNSPRYVEALERRAYALFATKRFKDASADFEAVLKAEPKRVDLYLMTGQAAFNLKDYKAAVAAFTVLADAKATKPPALKAKSLKWRAQARIKLGEYAKAVPDLTQAIALTGGKDPKLILGRGIAFHGSGNLEKAVVDYATYIDKTGGNPDVHARRGLALYDLKRFDEAIADWDKFIAKKPIAFAYYQRGLAWREAKQHEKAIADFGAAIKKDSHLVDAYIARGMILEDQKEYAGAIRDFDAAAERARKNPGEHRRLLVLSGSARHKARDYDGAIAKFDAALKIAGKASMRSRVLVLSGGSRLALGETAKAEADFEKALAIALPKAKKTVERWIKGARGQVTK